MSDIHLINRSGYKTEIDTRGHMFLSDEPVEHKGTDTGPNSYELLLSALGSCKAITMRMYAERKNFPLEEIDIWLSIDKIHAKDCMDCETIDGHIDKIEVNIKLTGNLDEEQTERILEISKKCPVQRTLDSEITIHTKLDSDTKS